MSQEEIDAQKDKFASDAMELARRKEDLKAMTETAKEGIKSIETLMQERLEMISTRQEKITGVLFGVPDHAKQRMNFYDSFGEMINSRAMTPDEKQGTLFIGEDPDGAVPDHITDVEFEEVGAPADLKNDPEYQAGVEALYNENEDVSGNVTVEVTEPQEDKPKKRSKAKKPAKDDGPEDQPI